MAPSLPVRRPRAERQQVTYRQFCLNTPVHHQSGTVDCPLTALQRAPKNSLCPHHGQVWPLRDNGDDLQSVLTCVHVCAHIYVHTHTHTHTHLPHGQLSQSDRTPLTAAGVYEGPCPLRITQNNTLRVSQQGQPSVRGPSSAIFPLFFFFFWPSAVSCGILVPQPVIEPRLPAAEARSPNHWTAREVPTFPLLIITTSYL